MLRKTKHLVNNGHIRYAIRNNVLPRLYKDLSKKEKDIKKNSAFSAYIKK